MDLKNITEVKKKIKDYVNNTDPWHLIEMGAPKDEYNTQIDNIVSFAINRKPDRATLESGLYKIFKTKEFELEQNKIKELAKNINSIEYL